MYIEKVKICSRRVNGIIHRSLKYDTASNRENIWKIMCPPNLWKAPRCHPSIHRLDPPLGTRGPMKLLWGGDLNIIAYWLVYYSGIKWGYQTMNKWRVLFLGVTNDHDHPLEPREVPRTWRWEGQYIGRCGRRVNTVKTLKLEQGGGAWPPPPNSYGGASPA